jgi:hypothetical protein
MKNRWIVHPVLFAILPILGLYAHNIGQLAMGDLLVPIALAAPASALLWFLLARRLRDPVRPALIASLFWLWFFSCGHVFALAVKIPGAAWVIPTRSAFTGIYAIPLLAGIALRPELAARDDDLEPRGHRPGGLAGRRHRRL